jgi:hypothetical protein
VISPADLLNPSRRDCSAQNSTQSIPIKGKTMELQDVLSLTAKLQAAEARALAAETALANLSSMMDAPPSYLFKDGQGWVPCSAVRKHVKAIDLTAAREMLRKAEDAETLRTERDELAALVEEQYEQLKCTHGRLHVWQEDIKAGLMPIADQDSVDAAKSALRLTPPAALAALRQKIRVEVLEATALLAEAEGDCYAFPDQGKPTTSECFRLFAHKIRAMKEAQ